MNTITPQMIAATHRIIETALRRSPEHPCVMLSFGKDSSVLAHLVHEHGVRDALYLEDVDEPVDDEHVAEMVRRYELRPTYLNRGRAVFHVVGGEPMLTTFVALSDRVVVPMPRALDPYVPGEPFACVDDELRASHGAMLEHPADLIFSGQKLIDPMTSTCRSLMKTDRIRRRHVQTQAALGHEHELLPGIWYCQPLYGWTDQQVWDYIDKAGIPWSHVMYNDQRQQRRRLNPACVRCHDSRETSIVSCPKRDGKTVINLAAWTKEDDLHLLRLERIGLMSQEVREELSAWDGKEDDQWHGATASVRA